MRLIGFIFLCFVQLASFQKIAVNTVFLNDKRIEYGNKVGDNDSDGYVSIYDDGNELIREIDFDNNGYEYFKYLAIVSEERFIVVCDTYFSADDFSLPVYRETVLLMYDLEGELINKEYIYEKPKEYHNHNYLLILNFGMKERIYDDELELVEEIKVKEECLGTFSYQFQGKAYINNLESEEINISYPGIYAIEIIDKDYQFVFTVVVHPDYRIEGKRFGEGYLGEVKIYSFGNLLLNQVQYVIGSSILEVGNYTLNIIGENGYRKDVEFVILPEIVVNDGLSETQLYANSEFMNPIRIFSNAQTMFLKDEVYSSSLINFPGNYTLVVYGINGYQAEIPFKIIPYVSGVENQEEYEQVEIEVFGNAFLNDEKLDSKALITIPGEYELKLMLDDEIYQTINFIILEEQETSIKEDTEIEIPKYVFLALALIGGLIILRKK